MEIFSICFGLEMTQVIFLYLSFVARSFMVAKSFPTPGSNPFVKHQLVFNIDLLRAFKPHSQITPDAPICSIHMGTLTWCLMFVLWTDSLYNAHSILMLFDPFAKRKHFFCKFVPPSEKMN
jgi:hypothetical protein